MKNVITFHNVLRLHENYVVLIDINWFLHGGVALNSFVAFEPWLKSLTILCLYAMAMFMLTYRPVVLLCYF